MGEMFEVEISPMSPARYESVLSSEGFAAFQEGVEQARTLLAGRVVWNVNSTRHGGGVAELLNSLVAYTRGAGVDSRWAVLEGTPEFFVVTKRIHNRLHGEHGDGRPLDDEARAVYERVIEANLPALTNRVRPGDVVIVHDPQPAGLIAGLRRIGAAVIWRCHVGLDEPNELAREAWEFLLRYVADADAYVFSRESFAWDGLDRERIFVIAPSIDVFSPKNEELDQRTVLAVLRACGVLSDHDGEPCTFIRHDGTPGRVDRRAAVIESQPLTAEAPLVVQVSRWDALKDPLGVVRGFVEHVSASTGAHLVYAGPAASSVDDDPEGARVLEQVVELRESLSEEQRARIHLASLPMDDPDENAIIINALQRHATVITQKSLAEGFGLTVAEAMWKARPVVASAIGGIRSQITDGATGVLLEDPHDLKTFGERVSALLEQPARARRMGELAQERVRDEFTSPRSLLDYLHVIQSVLGGVERG
jgi:trehalose synthase